LSAEEVSALARNPLIEIGAHTVTHASLPTLAEADQRREIVESRSRLEALVDRPLASFAYPFGDYADETVRLVREAGFQSACTTDADAVRPSSDPFRLPRMAVADSDGETFYRSLWGA
jgi:peptidoglycan/xylan/chitin deacetylase (PgdA/CDA1 family)